MQPYPYPHLSMQGYPSHTAVGCAHPQDVVKPPHPQQTVPHQMTNQYGSTWVASRRLPADDPERSLQFWENSRHTAAARVAEANEKVSACVAAALPDRVHSSMWHGNDTPAKRCTEPTSPTAIGSEPEPEPEPEPGPRASTLSMTSAHPPVFSAEVSQAAALYRAERERHALSVPYVRLPRYSFAS